MSPVVFDFDGVIARSMEQHAKAYAAVLGPLGVSVDEHDILVREGARSESIIRELLEKAGKEGHDIKALGNAKQRAFEDLGRPPLYDGAVALVERTMERADAVGLVTGTRVRNLRNLIPGLLPRFDAVLTQEDYTHDKPHPEPYAKAAQRLGSDPADCIAVENAVYGVLSARRAGYGTVLAVCTTLPAEDLAAAEPDGIAADHEALGRLLDEAMAGRP